MSFGSNTGAAWKVQTIRFRISKITLTLFLFALYGLGVTAQRGYRLEEVLRYAEEHNPQLHIAADEVRIAESKVRQTIAIGLPQLEASGQFQHFIEIPTTVVPAQIFNPQAPPEALAELQFGTKYRSEGGITLGQLIFNGSYWVGVKAARSFVETARLHAAQKREDVRMQAAQAYIHTLSARQQEVYATELVGRVAEMEALTEKLLLQGIVDKSAWHQIHLSHLQMRNVQEQLATQTDLSLRALKFAMGFELDSTLELSEDFQTLFLRLKALLDDSTYQPTASVPYRVLAHQLVLNGLQAENVRSEYLPSLHGFIQYSYSAQRNSFDFFDKDKRWYPVALWGVQLKVPLYDGGMKRARLQEVRIQRDKLQAQLHQMEESLRQQWQNTWQLYRLHKRMLANAEESLQTAEEGLHMVEKKYAEGLISSMELHQHYMQVLQRRLDIVRYKEKLLNNIVVLLYLKNQL